MQSSVTGRRRSLYGFEYRERDNRRAEPGERKTHDIKQIWQRSHEILRLALLGYKAPAIASMLDITTATVSNTLNSKLGMEKLSAMRLERDAETLDVAKEIESLYSQAIKIYNDILYDEETTMSLRKQTADTVLMDIGGYRAPSRFEGRVAHAHLTSEELEEIKRRGRAAALASGHAIDVTPKLEVETGE